MSIAERLISTKGISHDEWLEKRRLGIGGSDIGAICGVNPYKSPISVYLDKIGELPPLEENEAMHFGNQLEQVVADEYAERTGYKVQKRNAIFHHAKYPWALANVDRVILGDKRGVGVLEVKTASEYQAKQWSEGIVPEQYILQLQWYLWITGYTWGAFAVLVGGNKFFTHEMERDDHLIGNMIMIAAEFWKKVENCTPPAFDGSKDSESVLKMMYPDSLGTEIDLSDRSKLLTDYEEAKEQEAFWEAKKNTAENQIKALLGTNERARVGDQLITWKTQIINRIDSTRLKAELPEIYAQYLNASSSRPFKVK